MKQITVRNVSDRSIETAKRLAHQRGASMNSIFVEALERGLGLDRGEPTNGLERYSGDSDFGPEWDAYLTELRHVNPEDWK